MPQLGQLTESQEEAMDKAGEAAIEKDGGKIKHTIKKMFGKSTDAMDVLRKDAELEMSSKEEKTRIESLKISNEEALKLIDNGQGEYVAKHLDTFKELNNETALKLIEGGYEKQVSNNLGEFKELDYNVIAPKLIEANRLHNKEAHPNRGLGGWDAARLDGWLAMEILQRGGKDAEESIRWAKNHTDTVGMSIETALDFIDKGQGWFVVNNFGGFNEPTREKLSSILIENGLTLDSDVLYSYKGDKAKLAFKLIEQGKGDFVSDNASFFPGGTNEMALKIIEKGGSKNLARVMILLGYFKGSNTEVALKLVENGYAEDVASRFKYIFGEANPREVALKIIEKGEGYHVVKNLENFDGIHNEIASELIKSGSHGMQLVADNLAKFKGLSKENILAVSSLTKNNK